MKRFLRFEYAKYYPGGGMEDFVGDFDTLEEAKVFKTEADGFFSFVNILDTAERKIYTGHFEKPASRVVWIWDDEVEVVYAKA